MTKKERNKAIIIFSVIALVFLIGSIMTGGTGGEEESVQVVMRDAVRYRASGSFRESSSWFLRPW